MKRRWKDVAVILKRLRRKRAGLMTALPYPGTILAAPNPFGLKPRNITPTNRVYQGILFAGAGRIIGLP